ncbi:MAG: hypothetical protein ABFS34_07250 [Gemmatimonadota bacterium]
MSTPGDAGDVMRWLAEREPQPPPALATRIRSVVEAAADEMPSVPEGVGPRASRLGGLALQGLAALAREPAGPGSKELAAAGPQGAPALAALRARAADLLVVDALLTYALEAAAQDGPESVHAIADWLSPARLATLLPVRP